MIQDRPWRSEVQRPVVSGIGTGARADRSTNLLCELDNVEPLFMDAKALDFRLKPGAPAWKVGFKPIPVERIGLYQDELRASWPVRLSRFPTRRCRPQNGSTRRGVRFASGGFGKAGGRERRIGGGLASGAIQGPPAWPSGAIRGRRAVDAVARRWRQGRERSTGRSAPRSKGLSHASQGPGCRDCSIASSRSMLRVRLPEFLLAASPRQKL